MSSKFLVRILIVLLAAFLIFRIHQRVETYRVPRDLCRAQMSMLADANIEHMYLMEGVPAPDLDSLLSYAGSNGFFEASVSGDSIVVSFGDGLTRRVLIPDTWRALWDERAVAGFQAELEDLIISHDIAVETIRDREAALGFSLDSLKTLRDAYIIVHSTDTTATTDEDSALTPGEFFDDSLGFSRDSLLQNESELASGIVELQSFLQNFDTVTGPARMDSMTARVVAVCPSLWEVGCFDSTYNYDSKLALGSQYSISCPNIERHGGVVGGLVEAEYPDSLFVEADWAEFQTVYLFPEFAQLRRLQVSRANLIRAAEEEAAYLSQRYPLVIVPKDPANLDVDINLLVDPLGGEYVFQVIPDSAYTFYQTPGGTSARTRGDSITVQTYRFLGYTTADPDTSRVEVFFSRPLTFPSRADGAFAGMNDNISVIMYWERSELGSLQIEEREVDLLDAPLWSFLVSNYSETGTADTE
jgi:hypothetical protein